MSANQKPGQPKTNEKMKLWLHGGLGGLIAAGLEGGAFGVVAGAGLGVLYGQVRGLRRELNELGARWADDARPGEASPLPRPSAAPARPPLSSGASGPPPSASPPLTPSDASDPPPLPGFAPDVVAPVSGPPVPPASPLPSPSPSPSPSASPAAPSAPDRSRVQEWSPRDRPKRSAGGDSANPSGYFANGRSPGRASSGPGWLEWMTDAVSGLLFGGNAIVRVGLLVLFVGLTLLAKYAVDHALFPVEARLAAAAVLGLGLIGFGVRQRIARPGFGMSLQGGGFAVLYLVTFFAFRVYSLIGAGLAFSIFAALAVATALFAAKQRSQPLLIIGSLGGFAAPILASTGAGQHVPLFSYYLILTTSIAAVAWWRNWRWPGWVAFVCVYGVASIWGVLKYDPVHFSTTEPFLLAFLFLFTAIAVMHAWRRPPELRGLIDGTLVFGTPFISILYQSVLVRFYDHGLAKAAVGFALFYAVWAWVLRRFGPSELKPLIQAFVALAIGFATMAIPFAFEDGLQTATAWALEGAGLYWVGMKQDRRFPRFSGLLLQVLAGIACLIGLLGGGMDESMFRPMLNGRAMSYLALALAGLFVAYCARERSSETEQRSSAVGWGLGLWGLFWWSAGVLSELDQFAAPEARLGLLLAIAAATVVVLDAVAGRLAWSEGRGLARFGLPAGALILMAARIDDPNVLGSSAWLGWIALFAALLWLIRQDRQDGSLWPEAFRNGSVWFFAAFVALAGEGFVRSELLVGGDWAIAAFGFGLAVVLLLGVLGVERFGGAAFWRGALGPLALVSLALVFHIQFWATGAGAPMSHLPVVNPADATVLALALAMFLWWRRGLAADGSAVDALSPRARDALLGGATGLAALVGFGAINGSIGRTVHQWTDVPLSVHGLWNSSAFHMAISIAWTLIGLTAMWWASRVGRRPIWMASAALLLVVVLKLFLVDLAQLSTVTRIGTFIVVGLLLLVLGYLSPAPAGGEAEEGLEAPPD